MPNIARCASALARVILLTVAFAMISASLCLLCKAQDHLEREETVARFIRSRCGGCHTLRVSFHTLRCGRDQRGADCFFLGRLLVRLVSGPGSARSASA